MILVQTPRRTTRYDTQDRPKMMHRDKMRPRWTIEIKVVERYEWEIYSAMREWLDANIIGSRCYTVLHGGTAIRAITFRCYTDAMLFYVRFR